MREISAETIKDAVKGLFLGANYVVGQDVRTRLAACREVEESALGRSILDQILQNDEIAEQERVAVCQDTGIAVLFVELGQEVHVVGDFGEAVRRGVAEAYGEGYLRKSIVADPLFDRKNTGDNTPAVVHLSLVPGDRIRITVTPKGFGCENMSSLRMLTPADGVGGLKDLVVETVVRAGPNPCPPVIVGVGVGGTMELAAILAKKATLRPVGSEHPDPRYAALERELLAALNDTGVGPGGLGGRTTALAAHVEWAPTHIAGLPVAVNLCCHAARHAEATI